VKNYARSRIRFVVKWFYGGVLNFKTFLFSGRTHNFSMLMSIPSPIADAKIGKIFHEDVA